MSSTNRTFSEPAVMVIAGEISVGLLAKERKAIYSRKGENLTGAVAVNARLPSGNCLGKMNQEAGGLRGS